MKRKVPVTTRALVQRINRKLRDEDQVLKASRGRYRYELGNYYLLNFNRNWIVGKDIDPEEYGRELGVLADWEVVAED